jgi:4-diphosphocytidyl-2-C-methyl-D-erythritol kinase
MTSATVTPGYTIRLARHGEEERLPDIERRAASLFSGHEAEVGFSAGHIPHVNTVDTLTRANQDGRLWVAADADGAPVGFALVSELGLFAHLEELDVLPEHGRKGLGGALLEVVCEWAFTRGFSAVTLSTFRDVPWNAPFYSRRGFVVVDPSEQPRELARIVEMESQKGLRADLRVIMQREV